MGTGTIVSTPDSLLTGGRINSGPERPNNQKLGRIGQQKRDLCLMRLRRSGKTFGQIALKTGLPRSTVYNAIMRCKNIAVAIHE